MKFYVYDLRFEETTREFDSWQDLVDEVMKHYSNSWFIDDYAYRRGAHSHNSFIERSCCSLGDKGENKDWCIYDAHERIVNLYSFVDHFGEIYLERLRAEPKKKYHGKYRYRWYRDDFIFRQGPVPRTGSYRHRLSHYTVANGARRELAESLNNDYARPKRTSKLYHEILDWDCRSTRRIHRSWKRTKIKKQWMKNL